jgi:hypothetical protein
MTRRSLLLAGAALLAAPTLAWAASPARPAPAPEPRRVLAIFDSRREQSLFRSPAHKYAAMPLEWLGLTLAWHDLADGPPPPLWADPECRGAVTWFAEPCLTDIAGFADWAERLVAAGKRLVCLGELGPAPGSAPAPGARARLLAALGLTSEGDWSPVTLGDRVVQAEPGWGFEHPLAAAALPPHEILKPARAGLRPWLVLERSRPQARQSVVAATSQSGGYIAPGFATGTDPGTGLQRWRLDPFTFFQAAFALQDLPRADPTTLCGRRLFFAHVDGDGWRSISEVRLAGGRRATNAEVLLHRVLLANPELPITVAPIAAELQPGQPGAARAAEVARAILALPQVALGSHTYSHPFDWSFFEDWSPEKEAEYLPRYRRLATNPGAAMDSHAGETAGQPQDNSPRYLMPRAFGLEPFSLERETAGAARLLEALAPPGKRCTLLQWTGNCQPFAAAVAAATAAGLPNINGGDTRYDDDFPTVTGVAPLGRRMANGAVHVYAAASNENTYTENWSNRFFGFRDLPVTWARTGAPRRLKPINLYFHTYSCEREASLAALEANIAALVEQDCIPVDAARYARAAQGAFNLRLERVSPRGWRVLERGDLATLRFDAAAQLMADLDSSVGVLGETRAGETLWLALDPAVATPLVVLAPRRAAPPPRPLLVEASWEIAALLPEAPGWSFEASGYGPGEATWRMPRPGRWRLADGAEGLVGTDLLLRLTLPRPGRHRLVPA